VFLNTVTPSRQLVNKERGLTYTPSVFVYLRGGCAYPIIAVGIEKGGEMYQQSARHEFAAIIEGIELPPEVVDRVSKSIQKAVLTELADIDLQGSVALEIPPGPEVRLRSDRPPNGAWIGPR